MPGAVEGVVDAWSAKNLTAPADWIALFPDAATRQLALQIVMNQQALQNLAATETWVNNLPPGQFRDEAENVFASVKLVVEAN